MINTTGAQPYEFDFLDRLVAINFPSGGYIIVDIVATSRQNIPAPPPAPLITLTLDPDVKLVDQRQSSKTTIQPAHSIISKTFFIWSNIAPFPTAADFGNIVLVAPGAGTIFYGQQFSQVAIINFNSEFGPGPSPPILFEGNYGSLSNAAAAALALQHSFYDPAPIGSQGGYITDTGIVTFNAGPLQTPFAAELDIPSTIPGQGITTLTAKYLLKVPSKAANSQFHVIVSGPGETSTIKVSGYHGSPPKSLAISPGTADTTASGGASAPIFYTVKSVIASAFNTVKLNSSSGGGAS